jgi:hypothetical protein
MADIVAFPLKPAAQQARYKEEKVIGAESGIVVRILSRLAKPYDLLVILSGTLEGSTTVAALPAEEMAVAEAIANSTLAALGAAEITWRSQKTAS